MVTTRWVRGVRERLTGKQRNREREQETARIIEYIAHTKDTSDSEREKYRKWQRTIVLKLNKVINRLYNDDCR